MWGDVLYHSPVLLCCTINTNMNFYDMCDIPCLMSEWSLNNSTLCSSDVKSHSYSSIKSPSRLAALIAWVLKFDVYCCMNMSHFIVLCCLIPLSNHVTTCKKKNQNKTRVFIHGKHPMTAPKIKHDCDFLQVYCELVQILMWFHWFVNVSCKPVTFASSS